MGIISNIAKGSMDINDEVIAGNMISSAKSAADAYLNATMTSSTPELRAIYASSLNQIIGGHSALTDIVVNRRWAEPYSNPAQQLADTFNKSQDAVETKQ